MGLRRGDRPSETDHAELQHRPTTERPLARLLSRTGRSGAIQALCSEGRRRALGSPRGGQARPGRGDRPRTRPDLRRGVCEGVVGRQGQDPPLHPRHVRRCAQESGPGHVGGRPARSCAARGHGGLDSRPPWRWTVGGTDPAHLGGVVTDFWTRRPGAAGAQRPSTRSRPSSPAVASSTRPSDAPASPPDAG